MARGFAGEDESKRANDPISANDGLGQIRDIIAAAEASGKNVSGDNFQNELAQDILAGNLNLGGDDDTTSLAPVITPRFTDKYRQPDGTYSYPSLGAYLNAMGVQYGSFNPQQNLMGNMYQQLVPGGKTPLGVLSAFPAAIGLDETISSLISLGNLAAGKMNIGTEKDTNEQEPKTNGIADFFTGFQGHPGLR